MKLYKIVKHKNIKKDIKKLELKKHDLETKLKSLELKLKTLKLLEK